MACAASGGEAPVVARPVGAILLMARKITIKAFEAWIADEANVVEVLEQLSQEHLHKVAKAVKQPYTCLYAYFDSTPELKARFDAACRARQDKRADETQEIADGVAPDRDAVAKAKLQIDVRMHHAKAYNPERWGDRVRVEKDVRVQVDAGLLGAAGDLLAKIAARVPRQVQGVVLEQAREDVVPASLPSARAVESD